MVSAATISEVEESIDRIGYQCRELRMIMNSHRRETISNFRIYKAAKNKCLKLEAKIKDLKEDLRRFLDGR